MLQSRRTHQNQPTLPEIRTAAKRKSIRMINRKLQQKYAWLMGVTSWILMGAFILPAWYFVGENYRFFTRIAADTHPALLTHLEREQSWLNMLLLGGWFAAGIITGVTALRMTTDLLGPLSNMEKHMRKIIRGDWSQTEFHVRQSDDLRDITSTYSYLYSTMRAQAEADIRLLEKIVVDPSQSESAAAWLNLVNLKRKQLGLSETEFSEKLVSIPDSRRVS